MELLAEGRTAEVFAWTDGRVLKLDRPEWNGCAAMEAAVLRTVVELGVAAPRVYETVTVGARSGIVLERIDGPLLADVIAESSGLAALATAWVGLHGALNATTGAGLPDLGVGIASGIRASGLAPTLVDELLASLVRLDGGARMLCHFDLHPRNVIVAPDRWVVIDWLTASSGPPDADFARTLVLDPPGRASAPETFMAMVARQGMEARSIDRARLDAWIRIVAGARLAEGFDGRHAEYLVALASGARGLDY